MPCYLITAQQPKQVLQVRLQVEEQLKHVDPLQVTPQVPQVNWSQVLGHVLPHVTTQVSQVTPQVAGHVGKQVAGHVRQVLWHVS